MALDRQNGGAVADPLTAVCPQEANVVHRIFWSILPCCLLACGAGQSSADLARSADSAVGGDLQEVQSGPSDSVPFEGHGIGDALGEMVVEDARIAEPGDGVNQDLLADVAPSELVEDSGPETVDLVPELPPVCALGDGCDDGDPCTIDDQCDGQGGCAGSPMDCDDGNPCTDGDSCKDGECVAGPDICQCYTDDDCLVLEDDDLCNGTLFCQVDHFPYLCEVDPQTLPNCEANQPQQCALWGCLPGSGECVLIAAKEGQSCDDGDPCTTADTCVGVACVGAPLPGICTANEPFCQGSDVCLCDACGAQCAEVLEVCQSPAWECKAGECVPCQPQCQGLQCGDDGCGGSCGTCPGTSSCDVASGLCLCDCPATDAPVCDPLAGNTYGNACKAACAGVLETVPGICGSTCYTSEGAIPAKVGDAVAPFFCKDLNMNSPGLGAAVSDATLKEMIWIAYFGACT
jgi:hypothetical protein